MEKSVLFSSLDCQDVFEGGQRQDAIMSVVVNRSVFGSERVGELILECFMRVSSKFGGLVLACLHLAL